MFNTKYYNNLGTSFTEREIPVWNGELLGDIMQALVFRGNSVKLMYLISPEKLNLRYLGSGRGTTFCPIRNSNNRLICKNTNDLAGWLFIC